MRYQITTIGDLGDAAPVAPPPSFLERFPAVVFAHLPLLVAAVALGIAIDLHRKKGRRR